MLSVSRFGDGLRHSLRRVTAQRSFSFAVKEVIEGSAKMLHTSEDPVFYNNIQGINRDLSIQVIKLFSEVLEQERMDRYLVRLARSEAEADSNVFAPPTGITVLEGLAATGLRSVRYVQEIPSIKSLVLNDFSAEATNTAENTLKYNGIDMEKIKITNRDANSLMYEHKDSAKSFDVIDIDPYGSSAPFLDAAVQAVSGDGGLLCLTCTDYATLCGNQSATSLARYGTVNFRTGFKAEVALRTLLNAVDTAANRYSRYIVPWMSVSIDFYVRVFVRVFKSQHEAKNSLLKRLMLFHAEDCPSFYTHSLGRVKPRANFKPVPNVVEGPAVCQETGGRWKMGGPFWGSPLHHQGVVDELLLRVNTARLSQDAALLSPLSPYNHTSPISASDDAPSSSTVPDPAVETPTLTPTSATSSHAHPIPTAKRLAGVLLSISEELKDVPFYYCLPELAGALQCTTPSHQQFKSALLSAGYQVSHFHHDPNAFKTDAPDSVVWDIMRSYISQVEGKNARHQKKLNPVAQLLRATPVKRAANFNVKQKKEVDANKIKRFVPVGPNWGPRARARPKVRADKEDSKGD